MSKRDHIPDRNKMASVLCILFDIPYEHQLLMHRDQVISLFEWDHYPVRKADGGTDEFHNLRPLLPGPHAIKTATIDVPQIAKSRRSRNKQAVHNYKMAVKVHGEAEAAQQFPGVGRLLRRRKSKIANRGFPKGHRPMRSRNTFRRKP